MTLTGMNPAEVRQLAEQLRRGGEQLQSIVSAVDGWVTRTCWVGRDADMFKHQWWPTHRRALIQAAESVHGLGRSAQNNAHDQERVSSVNGSTDGGGSTAANASIGNPGTGGASDSTVPSATATSPRAQDAIAWARDVQATNPSGYHEECLRVSELCCQGVGFRRRRQAFRLLQPASVHRCPWRPVAALISSACRRGRVLESRLVQHSWARVAVSR
jgi:hypothetical protein